jgi:hypothetical protein
MYDQLEIHAPCLKGLSWEPKTYLKGHHSFVQVPIVETRRGGNLAEIVPRLYYLSGLTTILWSMIPERIYIRIGERDRYVSHPARRPRSYLHSLCGWCFQRQIPCVSGLTTRRVEIGPFVIHIEMSVVNLLHLHLEIG